MIENAEAKRAKAAAACRKWYSKSSSKGKTWIRKLKQNYQLSLEDYNQLLNEQNNACAICYKDQSELEYRLSVDHDHACCSTKPICGNSIRGLLCRPCNQGIGMLKDNVEIINNAIGYLVNIQKEIVSCG